MTLPLILATLFLGQPAHKWQLEPATVVIAEDGEVFVNVRVRIRSEPLVAAKWMGRTVLYEWCLMERRLSETRIQAARDEEPL